MKLMYGSRVSTPYGSGSVVEINEAYGVKVQYDNGNCEYHAFDYIIPAVKEVTP
jgi:hypothetical protein